MKRQAPRFLLTVMLLALCVPALAHHSFPAEFDKLRPGELKGTIVSVWYKNPHARYRMEVTTADGITEEWDVQTTSVTSLRRGRTRHRNHESDSWHFARVLTADVG